MHKSGPQYNQDSRDQFEHVHDFQDQNETFVDPAHNIFDQSDQENRKNYLQDPEEFQHFKDVVSAFFNYKVVYLKGKILNLISMTQ